MTYRCWARQKPHLSGASRHWHELAVGQSLVGRWGTPEDVAAAVRFLASPAAAFINGQTISVNGGFRSSEQRIEAT